MDSMGRIGAEDSSVSFQPPEGMKLSGDSGEATVTWRRTDDGAIKIETFDGVSLRPQKERETMEDDDGMEMEMDES